MVKCTGRGLVVKRPGVLSKVQMLTLVLGVVVFSLLPKFFGVLGLVAGSSLHNSNSFQNLFRQAGVLPETITNNKGQAENHVRSNGTAPCPSQLSS